VAAVFLGAVAGGQGWVLAAVVAGLVAATASFLCQAAELPPPRELLLVMAVLAATEIPADLEGALGRAGLTAAGAAGAWVISMAPLVLGVRNPEIRTLAAGLASVAALLDAIGTEAEATATHSAVLAVRRATIAVHQGRVPDELRLSRIAVAIEVLLEAALHARVESPGRLTPAWAVAVRNLIPALRGGQLTPANALPSLTPATAALANALDQATRAVGGWPGAISADTEETRLHSGPRLAAQLSAAWGRHSVIPLSAARIGIAVTVGVLIGQAIGVAHAYWVALTACAVLQASNLAVTRSRFLYRLAGTLIGVLLVFAVLSWSPPLLVVIAVAAAAQAAVELVITVNYGLAVVAITVLALLLFSIGAPGENVGGVLGARVIDTVVGAALALLLRMVLWPRATSARLPQTQARTLRAAGRVLQACWLPVREGSQVRATRRELHGELGTLRAVQADALADSPRSTASNDRRWPVTVAIEDIAYLALAIPTDRPAPPAVEGAAFLASMNQLAGTMVDCSQPEPTPMLPGHPRSTEALAGLRRAITDASH
jgi:hypothetical protein